MAPMLAKHYGESRMNQACSAHRRALEQRDGLGLDAEKKRVLERTRKRFVRSGAKLRCRGGKRLAAINERLATLGTQFGQNVLADEKDWTLVLDERDDLAGLPGFPARGRDGAGAEERGKKGKHVDHAVALDRSSRSCTFSTRRDLREIAFRAFIQPRRERRRDRQPRDRGARRWRCAPKRRGCSATTASPR